MFFQIPYLVYRGAHHRAGLPQFSRRAVATATTSPCHWLITGTRVFRNTSAPGKIEKQINSCYNGSK